MIVVMLGLSLGFPMSRLLCRHCCKKPVNRPRGLCWLCYLSPGVRDLYGRRLNQHATPEALPLPAVEVAPQDPSPYQPGTLEQMSVLRKRVENKMPVDWLGGGLPGGAGTLGHIPQDSKKKRPCRYATVSMPARRGLVGDDWQDPTPVDYYEELLQTRGS